MTTLIVTVLVIAVLCGVLAAAVASSRGLSAGGFFVVGFLLGVIGIIMAAVVRPPAQPAGWYADPWGQAPYRWWSGAEWTGYLQYLHDGERADH